jgi:hypothetical protein
MTRGTGSEVDSWRGKLDRQLRPERGPLGQPSRADFQAFELVEIIMASPQGSTDSRSSSLDVATIGC